MKTFKVNKNIEVICRSEKTRYGFRHLATLLYNGIEYETAKRCYYNRTWESYEFESALETLAEQIKTLSSREKRILVQYIKDQNRADDDLKPLRTVATIAKLGELLAGDSQKAKNDWKARMLQAGLQNRGLIVPDNWGELDENTKQARLDGAIAVLTQ